MTSAIVELKRKSDDLTICRTALARRPLESLSIRHLATLLEVAPQALSRFCRGEHTARSAERARVRAALNRWASDRTGKDVTALADAELIRELMAEGHLRPKGRAKWKPDGTGA